MFMALNNLVFYGSTLGEPSRREFYLKSARLLREEAENHGGVTELQLTYCRAILRYSQDEGELNAAAKLAAAIMRKQGISRLQAREAEFYSASLANRVRRSRGLDSPAL